MRPGMPDVVLRPGRGAGVLTFGPAFVSVADGAGAPRSFPRDGGRGAPGAASRLCAQVADGPPGLRLPEIRTVSLVDGRGAVLATLDWDGNDHGALERACAAARIALDRVPWATAEDGQDDAREEAPAGPVAVAWSPVAGQHARLPLPRRGTPPRAGSGVELVLALGPDEVAVNSGAGPGAVVRWPRLGRVPAGEPALARVRVTLLAERPVTDPDLLPGPPPGPQRVLGLTLLAADRRPLAYLPWVSDDLDALRAACAATGVQPEYWWQPRGEAAELAARGVPVVRPAEPAAPRGSAADRWLYLVVVLVLAALAVVLAVRPTR